MVKLLTTSRINLFTSVYNLVKQISCDHHHAVLQTPTAHSNHKTKSSNPPNFKDKIQTSAFPLTHGSREDARTGTLEKRKEEEEEEEKTEQREKE